MTRELAASIVAQCLTGRVPSARLALRDNEGWWPALTRSAATQDLPGGCAWSERRSVLCFEKQSSLECTVLSSPRRSSASGRRLSVVARVRADTYRFSRLTSLSCPFLAFHPPSYDAIPSLLSICGPLYILDSVWFDSSPASCFQIDSPWHYPVEVPVIPR